jgi:hypothetical protein
MHFAPLQTTRQEAMRRRPGEGRQAAAAADHFSQPAQPEAYGGGGEDSHYLYRMSRQDRRRPQTDALARRGWQETEEEEGGEESAQAPFHYSAESSSAANMSCVHCRCDSAMVCAGTSDPVCSRCTSAALQ